MGERPGGSRKRLHGLAVAGTTSLERGQSLALTHVQVRFGYLMRFSSSNSHACTATLTDWLQTPTRASFSL